MISYPLAEEKRATAGDSEGDSQHYTQRRAIAKPMQCPKESLKSQQTLTAVMTPLKNWHCSHFKRPTLSRQEMMQGKTDCCSIVQDACGLEKLYLIGVIRHAYGDCCSIVQGRSRI